MPVGNASGFSAHRHPRVSTQSRHPPTFLTLALLKVTDLCRTSAQVSQISAHLLASTYQCAFDEFIGDFALIEKSQLMRNAFMGTYGLTFRKKTLAVVRGFVRHQIRSRNNADR
jgi:hypothetical protein